MSDQSRPDEPFRNPLRRSASGATHASLPFRRLRTVERREFLPRASQSGTLQRAELVLFGLAGTLQYQDSAGNAAAVAAQDVFHAATGSAWSYTLENHSPSETARIVQVVLEKQGNGSEPACTTHRFAVERSVGQVATTESPELTESEARFHMAFLSHGQKRLHFLRSHRHGWVHILDGTMRVHGEEVKEGGGVGVSGTPFIEIAALHSGTILLVDLG